MIGLVKPIENDQKSARPKMSIIDNNIESASNVWQRSICEFGYKS